MADDNVIEVAIKANLAELNAGLNQAGSQVKTAAAKMNADVTASTAGMAQGMSSVGTSAAAAGTQIEETAQLTRAQMREAKAEVALLGEEIGVKVPRHLRGFLTELPGVGAALTAAFSATAVLMLIQIVVEAGRKVYEFIERIGELTEAERKSFKEVHDQAKELFDIQVKEIKAQYDLEIAKATGLDKERLRLEQARVMLGLGQDYLNKLTAQKQVLEDIVAKSEQEAARQREAANAEGETPQGQMAHMMGAAFAERKAEKVPQSEEWKNITKEIHEAQIAVTEYAASSIEQESKLTEDQSKQLQKRKEEYAKIWGPGGIIDKAHADLNASVLASEKQQDEALMRLWEVQSRQRVQDNEEQIKAYNERVAVAATAIDAEIEHERASLTEKQQQIAAEFQMHQLSDEQRVSALKKALDEEYIAESNALLRKAVLWKQGTKDYERVQIEIQKIDDKYRLEKQKLDQQTALQQQKNFQQMERAISTSFKTAIDGWIQGTQTLSQAFARMWQGIVASAISGVAQLAIQFLLAELLHKQSAARQALVDAKMAAIHAFKWAMQAIPYPANLIVAPIAAAGAFAGVMAFATFHQGGLAGYEMPAILRRDEMVLPPDISRGMQGLIAAGGGGMNIHVSMPVQAIDSRSFEGMMDKHIGKIAKGVRKKLKGVKL